jgi:hypothetical protein
MKIFFTEELSLEFGKFSSFEFSTIKSKEGGAKDFQRIFESENLKNKKMELVTWKDFETKFKFNMVCKSPEYCKI